MGDRMMGVLFNCNGWVEGNDGKFYAINNFDGSIPIGSQVSFLPAATMQLCSDGKTQLLLAMGVRVEPKGGTKRKHRVATPPSGRSAKRVVTRRRRV